MNSTSACIAANFLIGIGVGLGLAKLSKRRNHLKNKKITITYFNIPALAEPLRALLVLGDYDWSDEYPSDWPAMKPTTKWGQLPLMQIENGEQMSQTKAMFRFLAKQVVVEGAALYPDDPFEAFKVDELIEAFEDVRVKIVPSFAIKDQAEKEAFRQKLFDLPGKGEGALLMAKIEKLAGANGHMCGDSFTAADIWCFFWVNFLRCGFFDGLSADVCSPYPKLLAVTSKVAALPALKAHYTTKMGIDEKYAAFAE
eukprot:CAMPEP_0172616432 /NCGR_PEP_ID=MMETSP1068-20121228/64428_1 /TAXON_ID=35684 /ORGANISM="Pseudopedinella elastica, Strain CCMP716" /LENGTH=254 /DNA_ID=CAMNT_0013421859 /DNA_START=76 /DNA_END=840 /DNA_ORIENTATION=+